MLLARLEEVGHPAEQARTLLDQFEQAQKAQIEARVRLRQEAAKLTSR